MLNLRALHVVSCLVLGALVVITLGSPLFLPMMQQQFAKQDLLTMVGKLQIIERTDQWILQYNILNPGDKEQIYSFEITADSKVNTQSVSLAPKQTFQFIYHLYPALLHDGGVRFVLWKAAEQQPMEDLLLHLPEMAAPPEEASQ